MYSANFPDIFSGQKTNLISDKEAAISNLFLLLNSDKRTLLGDPYFGTELKKYLFSQNGAFLYDIIIDQIYSACITYIPQIVLKRDDIQIIYEDNVISAKVKFSYIKDQNVDTLEIKLMQE